MSLLTHLLVCLFGMGSWISINGLWVELPLIIPHISEGWSLPSYLSVLIQMANIGPLFVTLMHHFHPGVLNETDVIYVITGLGTVASFLLGFLWKDTVVVAGVPHSVSLLILTFYLAVVACTSSVTFLAFMVKLAPQYLTTYFIGEGMSGLLPTLVALIQGIGVVHCINNTNAPNSSSDLHAQYQLENFSAEVVFFILTAMMLVCLLAFVLLNHLPAVAREHPNSHYIIENESCQESRNLAKHINRPENQKHKSSFGTGAYTWMQIWYIFGILAWIGALINAVLPSVQSYSCMLYGNNSFYLTVTMAAVSNPLACFIALFLPIRSLLLMGVLTVIGSAAGAYIMGMAVLSPCPLLVNDTSGAVIIVLVWILFTFTLSYAKVIGGVILRDEGHSALVWCGAVVQLGSLLGAMTMFPLVSVYSYFSSGDPCNTKCA